MEKYEKVTIEKEKNVNIGGKAKKIFAYFVSRWWLLLSAVVTGTFTWHSAGAFWGSVFYQVMAVTFTEGALLVWVYRLEGAIGGGDDGQVDDNEWWQAVISGVSALLAFCAIVGTAMASATLIATQAGAFEIYNAVPAWAQWLITNLVWILAAYNVFAGGIYQALSPDAVLERVIQQSERRVKRAYVRAERERKLTEAQAYEEHALPLARQTGAELGRTRANERYNHQYAADSAVNFQQPPKH